MYLTWPAKYISSWATHLFHLPEFSTGNVKLQFAEHALSEGGARAVALPNNRVVGKVLRVVEVMAVSVIE